MIYTHMPLLHQRAATNMNTYSNSFIRRERASSSFGREVQSLDSVVSLSDSVISVSQSEQHIETDSSETPSSRSDEGWDCDGSFSRISVWKRQKETQTKAENAAGQINYSTLTHANTAQPTPVELDKRKHNPTSSPQPSLNPLNRIETKGEEDKTQSP